MKPLNILLVEDNEGDIVLATIALTESKIVNHLEVAKNGKMALDFIFQEPGYENSRTPDLILLDLNLPIINGHEVLKEIEDSPDKRHIPVIILTSSSSKKDIDLAYYHHVNGYITKPLDINEFQKIINSIESFGHKS